MEKDFSKGHFEQLLTERTGEYKMYPTERVWNSIYHRLHTRRKWRFIGGGTFALMILAAVFVLMQDNPHPPSHVYAIRTSGPDVPSPLTSSGPASGPSSSPVASLTNTSAARAWKSRPFSGNTYLSAGDYLLQSPAWMTSSTAQSPLLAQTAGTENPAIAPEKSAPMSVEPPAPGAGVGQDNALSHMIANEPLRAGALIADKASAVSSSPLKIIKAPTRYSWLFHFEPSISFRVLKSKTAITTTNLGLIVVDNNGYDINHLVDQRASVGFEAGADVLYSLTKRLRLKAGLQFNYSRYTAKAISTAPENVNVTLGGTGGLPSQTFTQTSNYANGIGQPNAGATWIPDQRVELSIPVGAEYQLLRNRSFSWNVAGTFQPSYILNSRSFVLSSDYKAYVAYPNLMRPWNVNLGLETFLRFDKGPIELQIGPQLRYQLLPSFISSYPISEHLYDIGFKIGIVRNIR